MAWAVRGRSSQIFGPSVWRAPTHSPAAQRRAIALTFDDGPGPGTSLILDLLAQHGVWATFFQVGSLADAYPAIAREVCDAGHEIGNHSHTHPNFALARPSFVEDEFRRAQEAIGEATGRAPVWLRAPYGVRWFGFRAMQKRLHLTGVMWSIIGCDWRLAAPAVEQRVLSRVRPGDIICLHDGRGTLKNPDIRATADAVARIVPTLLERGYHFETVTQLLCPTT
jgi:peptidoglycan/xylan/chitin deacetylase (PgdA/CDA1 family)